MLQVLCPVAFNGTTLANPLSLAHSSEKVAPQVIPPQMDVLKLVTDAKDSVIAGKDRELAAKDSLIAGKDREIALTLEARDVRERALQQQVEQQRREIEQQRRELEALRSFQGSVKSAVEEALREERARRAEQTAAARYRQEQRRLWLRSPDCLLQVLCLVAFNGHPAKHFASLSRAFRGDEVLWGCIKDRRGLKGTNFLMACTLNGDLARVRWLLDRGADVNAALTDSSTSLLMACEKGHLEIVRELLGRGANVNAVRTDDGMTSLMWACQIGHLEVVLELLGRSANVNAARTDDGMTSLIWACQEGHLEIVRVLLGRGAYVNAAKTDSGTTSLIVACAFGHLEVVRELLVQGANVNAARTDTGTTPLMRACQYGRLEIARLLLAHHASKTAVDSDGKTAYKLTPATHAELRKLVKP